ncbi:hypothetical protein AAMO2058_000084000 [Amorphochlora amoebiformis]
MSEWLEYDTKYKSAFMADWKSYDNRGKGSFQASCKGKVLRSLLFVLCSDFTKFPTSVSGLTQAMLNTVAAEQRSLRSRVNNLLSTLDRQELTDKKLENGPASAVVINDVKAEALRLHIVEFGRSLSRLY